MTSDQLDQLRERWELAHARARATRRPAPSFDQLRDAILEYVTPWLDGQAGADLGPLWRFLQGSSVPGDVLERSERAAAERWLTPEARAVMATEAAQWPGRELAWVLRPVAEGDVGRYGDPRLSCRGNIDQVAQPFRDFRDGDLILHTHPSGDLEPSASDLDVCARSLVVCHGLGYGIASPDGTRLYLVREPRPTHETAADDAAPTGETAPCDTRP